jgi:AcrR family transcriptional regulator
MSTKRTRRTREPASSGRARAAERTREEILLAAARAFAKGGVKTLRMEDIAREAGYTGPALYSYFKSKDEIFAALSEMVKHQFQSCFEQPLPPGLSFRQRLSLVTYRQLEVAERWRGLFLAHFMLGEAKAGPSPEAVLNIPNRIAEWFARDGGEELRGADPREAAFVFASIVHGFFVKWLFDGVPEPLPSLTERIVSYFFDGVGGPNETPR